MLSPCCYAGPVSVCWGEFLHHCRRRQKELNVGNILWPEKYLFQSKKLLAISWLPNRSLFDFLQSKYIYLADQFGLIWVTCPGWLTDRSLTSCTLSVPPPPRATKWPDLGDAACLLPLDDFKLIALNSECSRGRKTEGISGRTAHLRPVFWVKPESQYIVTCLKKRPPNIPLKMPNFSFLIRWGFFSTREIA